MAARYPDGQPVIASLTLGTPGQGGCMAGITIRDLSGAFGGSTAVARPVGIIPCGPSAGGKSTPPALAREAAAIPIYDTPAGAWL